MINKRQKTQIQKLKKHKKHQKNTKKILQSFSAELCIALNSVTTLQRNVIHNS